MNKRESCPATPTCYTSRWGNHVTPVGEGVLYFGSNEAEEHDSSRLEVSETPIKVKLDVQLILMTVIAALLILWPLLAYGRPAYIPDSASYYKGGRAATSYLADVVSRLHSGPVLAGANTSIPGPDAAPPGIRATAGHAEVKGARSVAYSLTSYIFGAPRGQMWLLAVLQALLTGFVIAVTLQTFGRFSRVPLERLATLAVASPVAFVVCLMLPDIFSALLILALTLLTTAHGNLSVGVKLVLVLIGTAAVTFHMSNLPIAAGLTVAAAATLALSRSQRCSKPNAQLAYVLAPLIIGIAVTVILNLGAFGGASLTGKRYPLTLARSVAEGPGKWYLEKNCVDLKYAICELYPHQVPATLDEFLWGKDGVKARASPDQLERIRAEESEVVMAAARAYPLQEASRLAINFTKQMGGFRPYGFDTRIELDSSGNARSIGAHHDPAWITAVHLLSIAGVIASLALLYRACRRRRELWPVVGMLFFGIALNAAICVYFSGPAQRYQARVIWIIPLLALAVTGRNEFSDRPRQARLKA